MVNISKIGNKINCNQLQKYAKRQNFVDLEFAKLFEKASEKTLGDKYVDKIAEATPNMQLNMNFAKIKELPMWKKLLGKLLG